jgi:hypothetical protein
MGGTVVNLTSGVCCLVCYGVLCNTYNNSNNNNNNNNNNNSACPVQVECFSAAVDALAGCC